MSRRSSPADTLESAGSFERGLLDRRPGSTRRGWHSRRAHGLKSAFPKRCSFLSLASGERRFFTKKVQPAKLPCNLQTPAPSGRTADSLKFARTPHRPKKILGAPLAGLTPTVSSESG